MATEIIYLGHDNTVDLALSASAAIPDLSSVTRMTLTIGGKLIDSAVSPGAFDWTKTLTAAEVARLAKRGIAAEVGDPKLIIAIGDQDVTPGQYANVYLVVYDPTNTNGVVWGSFMAEVLADVEGS